MEIVFHICLLEHIDFTNKQQTTNNNNDNDTNGKANK